jgi:hypothetical protein
MPQIKDLQQIGLKVLHRVIHSPSKTPPKLNFLKNIKLLAIPVHPEAHFISAKVLILCTPSYYLPVGPFGPS